MFKALIMVSFSDMSARHRPAASVICRNKTMYEIVVKS